MFAAAERDFARNGIKGPQWRRDRLSIDHDVALAYIDCMLIACCPFRMHGNGCPPWAVCVIALRSCLFWDQFQANHSVVSANVQQPVRQNRGRPAWVLEQRLFVL